MADYNIFREQLGIMYPKYGHALWDPSPSKPDRPVQVGDVGFIRMGKFHCLFNVLRPKDEQANVPEGYEPLVLKSSPHITRRSLNPGHYCSVRVGVDVEQDMHLARYPQVILSAFHRLYCLSPDDPREVSMKCSGRRGGALLSLPVNARREDTLAQKAFGEWMVKHIDHWLAFAQELQLGVECMEDIILVTGCDRTRSWTNIAFLEGQVDAKGTYREVVERADGSIEVQFSSGHVAGGVLSHGPQGKVRLRTVDRSQWICNSFLMILYPPEPTRGSMCIYPGISCRSYFQNISKASWSGGVSLSRTREIRP